MGLLSKEVSPIRNEYHSICYSISGIMIAVELVESKDLLKELL